MSQTFVLVATQLGTLELPVQKCANREDNCQILILSDNSSPLRQRNVGLISDFCSECDKKLSTEVKNKLKWLPRRK